METVENLTVSVSQLDQHSSELSQDFGEKARDEAMLPTVSNALKDTNSCIVSAFHSLTSTTTGLNHQLSDYLPRIGLLLTSDFENNLVVKSESSDHNVGGEEKHLVRSASEDNSNTSESEEAAAKVQFLEDSIGNLKHIVESVNLKLKQAEQMKEHWKLECQLLQMKLDKAKPASDEQAEDHGDHGEDKSNKLFKARLDELVAEKLHSDSKAAHFYLECLALQKRVKFWEKTKRKAETELAAAAADIQTLKDEATTTATNYESQLSMMSEHVANMNDKLTFQTDEIERLKFELKRHK